MGLATDTRMLLSLMTLGVFWIGVFPQGNQLQQIVIKICGERHLHVSEVVVDCAARVYGERGMHMTLRECVLTHLEGRDPAASLRVSSAGVEELCAWTNMSALAGLKPYSDADAVVPYKAGSTFYCALANLKITPHEYLKAYELARWTRAGARDLDRTSANASHLGSVKMLSFGAEEFRPGI